MRRRGYSGSGALRRPSSSWGEQGVVYSAGDAAGHVPAFEVDAVDTVAAGDGFAGALCGGPRRGAAHRADDPFRRRCGRCGRHEARGAGRHAVPLRGRAALWTRSPPSGRAVRRPRSCSRARSGIIPGNIPPSELPYEKHPHRNTLPTETVNSPSTCLSGRAP